MINTILLPACRISSLDALSESNKVKADLIEVGGHWMGVPLPYFVTDEPIIGIHHIQLAMPPGGEDAARRFYSGVLGIPEVVKPFPQHSAVEFGLNLTI